MNLKENFRSYELPSTSKKRTSVTDPFSYVLLPIHFKL